MKPVAKGRVKEVRIRVPGRVKGRRDLPRFGDAKVGEENVTIPSRDFVSMEHPDDQLAEDTDDPALAKTLANFISKSAETRMARERGDDESEAPATAEEPSTGAKGDRYVAPGARAAAAAAASGSGPASSSSDGTETTLRVSNLTKAVTEDDLRDLFGRFGSIYRIYLPRDADKVPRGYAYIAFDMRKDAEIAMDRLQGYGYDHLIIKIEWAKPMKEGGGGGGGGMSAAYVSGYGTKLAQETTEKVYYNSTGGGNR